MMEDFSKLAEFKIPNFVKARIKKFLSDSETLKALDKLFLSINYEESKKILSLMSPDKQGTEGIDKDTVGQMKYMKGRVDMLSRVFHYINLWSNRIKEESEKEKSKKEE